MGSNKNQVAEEVKRSSIVAKAEYVWKVKDFSWLVEALRFEVETQIVSKTLTAGCSEFMFQYTPAGGDEGTLAIWHCEGDTDEKGVTFRYRIYVRRRGGDFVQWGDTRNICMPNEDASRTPFGPDVPTDGGASPQGVFGLSHEALLKSEWVEDDTLTVRFELEVRLPISYNHLEDSLEIEATVKVPSTTIATDLLSSLDTGRCSDVTILVDGETIKAHSLILCSRSDVFDKLLNGGMRESVSKQVQIEDCSALTFKAVLRFLYTDDLACMNEAMDKATQGDQSSATWLQNVLAVSHKYALVRLQAWCEQKLCGCIAINEVCSILCQAHLYDAKQLASACLNFIRENYATVMVTEKFGTLAREWPEVILKINLCTAGVSEARAKPAIEASGKRKRSE